jgi:hypothetical protein
MQVDLNEVEKIALLLISKLKESKGEVVDLENDFYWDIPKEEIYNPYKAPKELTLGQLSDDLAELQRDSIEIDATPYDLKRLSEILKAISTEYSIAF